jgi:hypothetical protein
LLDVHQRGVTSDFDVCLHRDMLIFRVVLLKRTTKILQTAKNAKFIGVFRSFSGFLQLKNMFFVFIS